VQKLKRVRCAIARRRYRGIAEGAENFCDCHHGMKEAPPRAGSPACRVTDTPAGAVGQPVDILQKKIEPRSAAGGMHARQDGRAVDENGWHLRASNELFWGSGSRCRFERGGATSRFRTARPSTRLEAAVREVQAAAWLLAAERTVLGQLVEGVILTTKYRLRQPVGGETHGTAQLHVPRRICRNPITSSKRTARRSRHIELPLARAVRGDTVKDARWRSETDGTEILLLPDQCCSNPLSSDRAVLTLRDTGSVESTECALVA